MAVSIRINGNLQHIGQLATKRISGESNADSIRAPIVSFFPVRSSIVFADPIEANKPFLNSDQMKGSIVVIKRGGDATFNQKIQLCLFAEAAGIIVGNNDVQRPEAFFRIFLALDHPQIDRIPTVMISAKASQALERTVLTLEMDLKPIVVEMAPLMPQDLLHLPLDDYTVGVLRRALLAAVSNNDVLLVSGLIQKLGSDVASKAVDDDRGMSAAHICVEAGFFRCLELLIEAKLDMETLQTDGFTPLHLAAEFGFVRCTKLLLSKAWVFVDCPHKMEWTALHFAAKGGHVEVGKLLLHAGAQPNYAARDGCTPLHIAAIHRNASFVELLLKHGASCESKEAHNRTPLDFAIQRKDATVIAYLRNATNEAAEIDRVKSEVEKSETEEMRALAKEYSGAVKVLVDASIAQEFKKNQDLSLLRRTPRVEEIVSGTVQSIQFPTSRRPFYWWLMIGSKDHPAVYLRALLSAQQEGEDQSIFTSLFAEVKEAIADLPSVGDLLEGLETRATSVADIINENAQGMFEIISKEARKLLGPEEDEGPDDDSAGHHSSGASSTPQESGVCTPASSRWSSTHSLMDDIIANINDSKDEKARQADSTSSSEYRTLIAEVLEKEPAEMYTLSTLIKESTHADNLCDINQEYFEEQKGSLMDEGGDDVEIFLVVEAPKSSPSNKEQERFLPEENNANAEAFKSAEVHKSTSLNGNQTGALSEKEDTNDTVLQIAEKHNSSEASLFIECANHFPCSEGSLEIPATRRRSTPTQHDILFPPPRSIEPGSSNHQHTSPLPDDPHNSFSTEPKNASPEDDTDRPLGSPVRPFASLYSRTLKYQMELCNPEVCETAHVENSAMQGSETLPTEHHSTKHPTEDPATLSECNADIPLEENSSFTLEPETQPANTEGAASLKPDEQNSSPEPLESAVLSTADENKVEGLLPLKVSEIRCSEKPSKNSSEQDAPPTIASDYRASEGSTLSETDDPAQEPGLKALKAMTRKSTWKPMMKHKSFSNDNSSGSASPSSKVSGPISWTKASCLEVIKLDVARNKFPQIFQNPQKQKNLQQVIRKWLFMDEENEYRQGLDAVATPLMLVLGEEEAPYALEEIIKHYGLNFFQKGGNLDVFKPKLNAIYYILLYWDPELGMHLRGLDIVPELFAVPWLTTIFSSLFSFEETLYLWDTIFMFPFDFLIAFSVSLLIQLRKYLLQATESSEILMQISSLNNGQTPINLPRCCLRSVIIYRKIPLSIWKAIEASGHHSKQEAPLETGLFIPIVKLRKALRLGAHLYILDAREDASNIQKYLDSYKNSPDVKVLHYPASRFRLSIKHLIFEKNVRQRNKPRTPVELRMLNGHHVGIFSDSRTDQVQIAQLLHLYEIAMVFIIEFPVSFASK